MEIVDSQVHVWLPSQVKPGSKEAEEPAFSYQELIGEMDAAGVARAVLVPRSFNGDDNSYALEAAAMHPDRFAVMGRMTLDDPESRVKLAALRDTPGMLGLRLTFHKANSSGMLTDGTADWLWPEAERLGVPLMVNAPTGHAKVAEIAQRHPGLRIIYDHMGLSRQIVDEGTIGAARRMAALAVHPNIHVKVSALPLFTTQSYPFPILHGPIKRVFDAFGPERTFWGTDMTQYRGRVSYNQAVELFTRELSFFSAEDIDWVMGRGLRACLGW